MMIDIKKKRQIGRKKNKKGTKKYWAEQRYLRKKNKDK